jgi:hypothetical protein
MKITAKNWLPLSGMLILAIGVIFLIVTKLSRC